MPDADKYRRRADTAERWARECREKIGYKPHSRAAYEMQHDWAIAEIFYYDALSRAAVQNPDDMASQMREFQKIVEAKPISSTAIDSERFLGRLKFLVRGYLEKGE